MYFFHNTIPFTIIFGIFNNIFRHRVPLIAKEKRTPPCFRAAYEARRPWHDTYQALHSLVFLHVVGCADIPNDSNQGLPKKSYHII